MSLDRVLRLAVRNFSTLFLVVFVIVIPLHVVYAFLFHDVFAVRELHSAIAEFPQTRMVRGVGRGDLVQARVGFWVLVGIELALIPLVLRPLRRVLRLDAEGAVPDAIAAWRTMNTGSGSMASEPPTTQTLVVGTVLGIAIGALTWLVAVAVVGLLPDPLSAFGFALGDATARSAGAALGLVGFALRRRDRTELKV